MTDMEKEVKQRILERYTVEDLVAIMLDLEYLDDEDFVEKHIDTLLKMRRDGELDVG